MIRNQPANLQLSADSKFDIVNSDIDSLAIDESVVELYETLIKDLEERSNINKEVYTPQYFDNGESIDARHGSETAEQIAVEANRLLKYLTKLQALHWAFKILN